MFLSRVKIGSYHAESIWVGSFWVWVYSSRFLSVPVLSGKRNLDPKGIFKFLIRFESSIFGSVPVWVFGSRLKCPCLS